MGSSSVANGNNDVGTSAEQLLGGRQRRESVLIKNNHASQILYLGSDDSVSSSNGMPLAAGESVRLQTNGPVWAIASGASTDVRYFEEY